MQKSGVLLAVPYPLIIAPVLLHCELRQRWGGDLVILKCKSSYMTKLLSSADAPHFRCIVETLHPWRFGRRGGRV